MSATPLRHRLALWIESSRIQYFIIALIMVNAVTLGLETSPQVMTKAGPLLIALDTAILSVFVAELLIKMVAFGPRFFRQPWNVFDFIVVGVALVPASGPLAVLRALRVLRVLRLVSMMPRLRFVVEALLQAVPGITSIAALMLLIFYVSSVMATGLFGQAFPEWFGSVGASMYTLFQVMTLESWSMGIARPVIEVYPYAWLFFIPFILIATFTMLNLFIAIIVNTMQTLHEATLEAEENTIKQVVHDEGVVLEDEIRSLRDEIRSLRKALDKGSDDKQGYA